MEIEYLLFNLAHGGSVSVQISHQRRKRFGKIKGNLVAELPAGEQTNGVVRLRMCLGIEHPTQHHDQYNHQHTAANA